MKEIIVRLVQILSEGTNISFVLITVLVLASATVAALSRSVVQAAFALFFTLLGMAGYYVLLGSGFLAITQIVIYVGGILVLLMFGILLTNRPLQREKADAGRLYLVAGAIGAVLFLGVLVHVIVAAPWAVGVAPGAPAGDVRPIGRLLFDRYLLAFEVAGMTLLLCLVGAAYLVRRRDQ
ncbi:NADH-quinone oxidoreductase subunit J [Candidatus Sumerlaeota bacterium]|nr:NADH-quinone oxidoreductase subunit J [Candidatus Sumerlaeota bacterium]